MFYVSDIIAAGGGNWTRTAKDFTTELVKNKEVEVTVPGSAVLGKRYPYLPFYLAEINVVEEISHGPLDPVNEVRINLSKILCQSGLALPSRRFWSSTALEKLEEVGVYFDYNNDKFEVQRQDVERKNEGENLFQGDEQQKCRSHFKVLQINESPTVMNRVGKQQLKSNAQGKFWETKEDNYSDNIGTDKEDQVVMLKTA